MPLNLSTLVNISKALSDPNRLRALMALGTQELCLCQITELLNLAPSTVSKHMSVLKQAGLVTSRKDEKWVYYRITEPSSPEGNFVQTIYSLIEQDKTIKSDRLNLKSKNTKSLELICKEQRMKL